MRTTRILSYGLVLVISAATVAHAQPGGDPAQPLYPPGPPAEPQPQSVMAPPAGEPAAASQIPAGIIEDANSSRVWLSPTALMAPAGTWSFDDYELFFIGGSYAITDQLQLSGVTLLPLVSGQPFIALVSAKLGLITRGRLHLAVQASTMLATGEADSLGAMVVGGAATLCLDADCHSIVNGYVATGFSLQEETPAFPVIVTASLVQRLSARVKLAVEIDSGLVLGEINEVGDGFVGWYGLRFTSRNIGVDVGFVRPFAQGYEQEVLPLGIPWLNFTYRAI